MNRVEPEGDDAAASERDVEYRGTPLEFVFSLHTTGDHEGLLFHLL